MEQIELCELVGGALQEKFQSSFEKVIENMLDVNTSFRTKRKIVITMDFTQTERRDDIKCDLSVTEKLASQTPMETRFFVGKDLKSGKISVDEYGRQCRGQMSLDDYGPTQVVDGQVVDTDTGEIIPENTVVDFRKVNEN